MTIFQRARQSKQKKKCSARHHVTRNVLYSYRCKLKVCSRVRNVPQWLIILSLSKKNISCRVIPFCNSISVLVEKYNQSSQEGTKISMTCMSTWLWCIPTFWCPISKRDSSRKSSQRNTWPKDRLNSSASSTTAYSLTQSSKTAYSNSSLTLVTLRLTRKKAKNCSPRSLRSSLWTRWQLSTLSHLGRASSCPTRQELIKV